MLYAGGRVVVYVDTHGTFVCFYDNVDWDHKWFVAFIVVLVYAVCDFIESISVGVDVCCDCCLADEDLQVVGDCVPFQ